MALLFADGFDWLAAIGDITMRWDTVAGITGSLVASANTAFGVGGAIAFANTGNVTKAWGSNDGTIFGTFRHKATSSAGANSYFYLEMFDTTNAQVTIRWNEDTTITVTSGTYNGTVLGTAVAGAFSVNQWNSWQVKIVIHNTTGSVEIRKNGAATPLLALTNINTRAGSTNAYANKVQIGSFTTGTAPQVDDFMLCSGSGAVPNDWLGDLRCWPNVPNGTAQSQWAYSPTSTTWGTPALVTNPNLSNNSANLITYWRVTAPHSGTITQITLNVAIAYTGSLNVALYDSDGTNGGPGTMLAQSTGKTNPAIGLQVYALGSLPVVRGRNYWATTWWSNGVSSSGQFFGTTGLITAATQSLTYTGTFPATAGAAAPTNNNNGPTILLDLAISSYSMITDPTGQDGDTSYVYSSTVGQEDLYSFPTLASQSYFPQSIVGIIPFAIVKKSDAGARTLSVRCKSGSTDASVIADAALPGSYVHRGTMLTTDPNTGGAWTATTINAAQIGVKVDV